VGAGPPVTPLGEGLTERRLRKFLLGTFRRPAVQSRTVPTLDPLHADPRCRAQVG